MISEKRDTAQENVQAFEKMHFRLRATIVRYAYYMTGSNLDTEDIAQEVFIKLWSNWNRFGSMDLNDLEDYVYAVVRNHILNEKTKSKGKYRRQFLQYVKDRGEGYWHDEFLFMEGIHVYQEAVEQLPERSKIVYLLYNERDYKADEIATTFRRSVSTVNNQLTTAHNSVKAYLNKRYGLNFQGRRQIWKPQSLN